VPLTGPRTATVLAARAVAGRRPYSGAGPSRGRTLGGPRP